jgi:predicted NBD/HSP70 family sugar kinase
MAEVKPTDQRGKAMPGSAGRLLALIRSLGETTRAELASTSGLARSTVASLIGELLTENLITEGGTAQSTGGRPATLIRFNENAGLILAADLGATHGRLAVCDFGATPLITEALEMDIGIGPEAAMDRLARTWGELLDSVRKTPGHVRGIGLGVPGPVEFAAGRAVHPPIMPGWDGYEIAAHLRERHGVPAVVDNDVNIMALGERSAMVNPPDDMVFVKVGTGIGSGLILGGRMHRGATGTAGDIGHIQIANNESPCRCGNVGCLEAVAGGGALARELSAAGLDVVQSRDVVKLVRNGEHDAIHAVRRSGRVIGEALASIVNLLNPSLIVVGGDLAGAGEQMVAGIREVIYKRSTALATHALEIRPSKLGDHAGVVGAAMLALDRILDPVAVDAVLERSG